MEDFRRKDWDEKVYKPFVEDLPERTDIQPSTSGWMPPVVAGPRSDEDLRAADDYQERLGWPGEYPFTRGATPTGTRGKLWTMRQYAGFATAEETNKRYRFLLDAGQTGLSVAFDLPTQMGYASNDRMAHGEVGNVGVPIDTVEDMRTLFSGIPLDKVSTSMTINAPAAILLGFYQIVAEMAGVAPRKLRGTIQNDILKEYMARGTYIFPPAQSMTLTVDIFQYCQDHLPLWNTISVSGYHIREAGCTAVQEVAFTLADAIAYLETAIDAGMEIDEVAPRISFFFNSHNNFLEEVAKFRAARRLWARTVKARFGAKNPKSMLLRFHAQTAGSTLTAEQPLNNIIRTAYQALAAVLGGTQSLHTNSYDEALALPTEGSVEIALRTQQILAYETGVPDTIDPLAGSYLIEDLTDRIEEEASAYIARIDEMGGMVNAIEAGYPQREIHNAAYLWQTKVDRGERVVVGVNRFENEKTEPIEISHRDESAEADQVERLAKYLDSRDESARADVTGALGRVKSACESGSEITLAIVQAIRAGATEGEMVDAMVEVWGRHRESVSL